MCSATLLKKIEITRGVFTLIFARPGYYVRELSLPSHEISLIKRAGYRSTCSSMCIIQLLCPVNLTNREMLIKQSHPIVENN